MVVAPASAIQAALCEAAADVRLSSLALRLRAAADALGLPQHQPQRFEAIVIDAAGAAGANADAPVEPAPAQARVAQESSMRRTAIALSSSGAVRQAPHRGELGGSPARTWDAQRLGTGGASAGRHLQAGAGLGSRDRERARFGTPHEQRAPVPV